jgi:cellulase
VCDKSGCGFNSYALGQKNYYKPGGTVDTSKPFTVTTQFITDTGCSTGKLIEIRRKYKQDGVVIENAIAANSSSYPGLQSVTSEYCDASDSAAKGMGGLATQGEALARGMVLIFSIWNDATGNMTWLDSGNAGPCTAGEGSPTVIESKYPDTSVTFSNIRWGTIGSTA